MGSHPKLSKEHLLSVVVSETINAMRLIKCFICGGPLGQMECMYGVRYNHPTDIGESWYHCRKCSIVWRLVIRNWVNERGDGMITGEGHDVTLHAYSNCYCRAPLLTRPNASGYAADFGVILNHNTEKQTYHARRAD